MKLEPVDKLPPAPRGSGARALEAADKLRANPGVWHRYPIVKAPAVTASNIRLGRIKAFPRGEFEAHCRGGRVYVRYVGGEA